MSKRIHWPHVLSVFFLISFWLCCSALAAEGKNDLVLIVDTSKSMRGAGGFVNIFGRVKESCKQIIRELGPGDTVTIISFDSSVNVYPTVTILGETELNRVDSLIEQLRAEGDWTFTAKALRNGLEEAARLEKTFPSHNQAIVILTDGLNDPPPGDSEKDLSLEEVAKPYAGKPWYVYQVQLGPRVDAGLAEALKSFPHGSTIHDPKGPRLKELHEKVKPKPKDVAVSLSAKPSRISISIGQLGKAEKGEITVSLPEGLTAALLQAELKRASWPGPVASKISIVSDAEGKALVRLEAVSNEAVPDGDYTGTLVVSLKEGTKGFSAVPLEVPASLELSLVPPTWPYWLAGIAAALALIALLFLFRTLAARRRLFGEIRCWHKDRPADVKKYSLEEFGSKAIVGADQIPLPGVEKPLGTLAVKNVDLDEHGKERLVAVTANEGISLSLDERGYSELPLFDRDQFMMGDWLFEYRGDVPRRPSGYRY